MMVEVVCAEIASTCAFLSSSLAIGAPSLFTSNIISGCMQEFVLLYTLAIGFSLVLLFRFIVVY